MNLIVLCQYRYVNVVVMVLNFSVLDLAFLFGLAIEDWLPFFSCFLLKIVFLFLLCCSTYWAAATKSFKSLVRRFKTKPLMLWFNPSLNFRHLFSLGIISDSYQSRLRTSIYTPPPTCPTVLSTRNLPSSYL